MKERIDEPAERPEQTIGRQIVDGGLPHGELFQSYNLLLDDGPGGRCARSR